MCLGARKDMEHRWGKRCSVDLPVLLRLESGRIEGRVRELSLSGAYLATAARVGAGQSLSIELAGGELPPVVAWVIRQDAHGLAVEWQEFAPWPIALTLETATSWAADDPPELPDLVGNSADRTRSVCGTACSRGH
jgi:hypothetical protein